METLQHKHRQELKDLQARITQKKKSATKKTRKGINDECAELEQQLKTRHSSELSSIVQSVDSPRADGPEPELNSEEDSAIEQPTDYIDEPMKGLSVSDKIEGNSNGTTKKPNRQKQRLARRAAEQAAAAERAAKEAEDVPDLRAQESESMRTEYQKRGLKEQPIRSDGHCLYAAVADQLMDNDVGLRPKFSVSDLNMSDPDSKMAYQATRNVAASYIADNPDEFAAFLEEPLETYVRTIRETGEWGGHLELLALAKAYAVDINILQANGKVETIGCGSSSEAKPMWLAYYRHIYGLGEHYNSLRQASK